MAYRVARRVAVRLARQRARRPANSADLDRVPAVVVDRPAADEAAAVWAEVDRLPERYRVPVLLCFFEGLTHAEAARRTGWPVGTVAGRLARAKDLLARRLTPKGMGVAGAALGAPAGRFVGGTARAAVAFAARLPVVPGVDPSVARLPEGALAMTAVPMKLATAAVLACAATAGVWALSPAGPGEPQPAARPAPAPVPPAQPADGERVADGAQRVQSIKNLRLLILAMLSYHDTKMHLPRDVVDVKGKALLSWRVAVLPYLEEEKLYKQFKLDEPWDSEHNKKLLAKMPDVFRVGFEPKDSVKTYYQGFAGKGAAFEPGARLMGVDVTDGTSNTIGIVEAGPPVEWTKPADLPFDPNKPFPKLARPFKNTLMVGMLDGSALALDPDLDADVLKNLVGRADGLVTPERKKLEAKFALSNEDVKMARDLLAMSEKAAGRIAAELREQQKLVAELEKRVGGDNPLRALDFARLANDVIVLEGVLQDLQKQTEGLRELAEAAGKK
ncbi:MAG: hypothetical protein C0501_02760 [Isosphaera sp.]|nr:hypothetical protein [Isosphaera sp.]